MQTRVLLMCTLSLACAFLFSTPAYASETEGTISGDAPYAWGENMGWINFAPDEGGLTITDSGITGYVWSSTAGWINFSPTNSGQGVTNTPEGVLGGSAWVQDLGWLDMTGVTINSTGILTGIAGTEGSQVGRVSFDCARCSVQTDWRPASVRNLETPMPSPPPGSGAPVGSLGVINTNPSSPSQEQNTPTSIPASASTPSLSPTEILLPLHLTPLLTSANVISAFNKPLVVTQSQQGELVQTFGPNTVVVDVPAGASSETLTITVVQSPQPADSLGGAEFVGGVVFDVTARDSSGNEVHHFDKPIKITLSIPEPLQGGDIGVYWSDESANTWDLVPDTTITPSAITFFVDHLTRFAILHAPGLPQTIAVTSSPSSSSQSRDDMLWVFFVIVVIVVFVVMYRRKRSRMVR